MIVNRESEIVNSQTCCVNAKLERNTGWMGPEFISIYDLRLTVFLANEVGLQRRTGNKRQGHYHGQSLADNFRFSFIVNLYRSTLSFRTFACLVHTAAVGNKEAMWSHSSRLRNPSSDEFLATPCLPGLSYLPGQKP